MAIPVDQPKLNHHHYTYTCDPVKLTDACQIIEII